MYNGPVGSQVSLVVKNLPANEGDIKDMVQSLSQENPIEGAWKPTAVFLTGESHRQRSLVGYSSYGNKESDMTEVT